MVLLFYLMEGDEENEMRQLFNMDNGIFRWLSKAFDCIWLNLLFLLTCIPIFTIGAGMTAYYYTMQKVIRHDRDYVGSAFWHGFKTNFKQATLTWLIALLMMLLTIIDFRFMKAFAEAGHKVGAIYPIFLVLFVFVVLWCVYLFPYMSRFVNTMRRTMWNALLISILNLPWTALILVLIVLACLAMYIMPISLFFVPAIFVSLLNRILERIFRKYMSEEDRAMEDELNQEYKN